MSKRYFIFGGLIAAVIAVVFIILSGTSFGGISRGKKSANSVSLSETVVANEDVDIVLTSIKSVNTESAKEFGLKGFPDSMCVINFRTIKKNTEDKTRYDVVFTDVKINGEDCEFSQSESGSEAGQIIIQSEKKTAKIKELTVKCDVFDATLGELVLRSETYTFQPVKSQKTK